MSNGRSSNGPSGDSVRRESDVMTYLQSDRINALLYLARFGTLICGILFFFAPILSSSSAAADSWYRRALLASAVSSALRLQQRFRASSTSDPSRGTLEKLIVEDSFHYLLFSINFAIIATVSVSLVPVLLLAVLHLAHFTQVILDMSAPVNNAATGDGPDVTVGPSQSQPSYLRNLMQTVATKVNSNDQAILRMIALNEIMLMPICIFMAFSGPKIIILPFVYYPFLKMRYNSRRNPHSRAVFYELRVSLQTLAGHTNCPKFISQLIHSLISLVSKLGQLNTA